MPLFPLDGIVKYRDRLRVRRLFIRFNAVNQVLRSIVRRDAFNGGITVRLRDRKRYIRKHEVRSTCEEQGSSGLLIIPYSVDIFTRASTTTVAERRRGRSVANNRPRADCRVSAANPASVIRLSDRTRTEGARRARSSANQNPRFRETRSRAKTPVTGKPARLSSDSSLSIFASRRATIARLCKSRLASVGVSPGVVDMFAVLRRTAL